MRAFVILAGTAALLAGCNKSGNEQAGNEQQLVENGIRGQLTSQGTVTQIGMTRQGDGNYAGTATVRTSDGAETHVSCTANKIDRGFATSCTPVLDQAQLSGLEARMRQLFAAQGLTVVNLHLARQDDEHITGNADLRNQAGEELHYPCTGGLGPTGRFEAQCVPQAGAAPNAASQAAAPADGGEQAPDGQEGQ
jgi:hypothetical protein